jgi:hypothetical protein
MVFNSSCTRAGCHVEYDYEDDDEDDDQDEGRDDEMEDRSKATLVFRGKIKFRHDKHLGKHPRGKVLNCVSCHGQAIEGQHISVTEATCVTCHFYGRGSSSVAAGKCETCHAAPEKDVTFAGHTFKHTAFLKGKEEVECTHCHSQVTQGDGAVSRSRCRLCHLRVPAEIEDQAKFHLVHTSEGHFDCQYCHDEIKHGTIPMEQQLLASSNCNTCHGEQRHTIQEKIYAGVAIPKLEKTPDVMYEAGVACDGCHTNLQVKKVGEIAVTTRTSGAKPCVSCHADDSYGEQLVMWQEDTKDMINKLEADVKKVEDLRRSTEAPEAQVTQADKQLEAARTKLSHVVMDGSYGAHNIMYVTTILEAAEEELNQCVGLLNGEER